MAKGGGDGWIAAKTVKKVEKLPKPTVTVKSTPTKHSPPSSQQDKKDQKKKKPKPVVNKKPFDVNDSDVSRMSGSGTGVSACMNCLNFLTTEFTAPEQIPPYAKLNFPASKLSPKVTERINAVLDTLTQKDDRESFLKVLVNNMISTSRRAENAWGARAMGQLFMAKYPEMAVCTSDVLANETHPGAVMSVLWMYSSVGSFQSLMSVLFWLVTPRLKQKKVADFLPEFLAKLDKSLSSEKKPVFSAIHIECIIRLMDDSKLHKQTIQLFTSFYRSIEGKLNPDHKWIERFIPLLSACNRQYALPLILRAIETAPEKATQELVRLAEQNRLQVDQILEACPESTLSEKYRTIIAAQLVSPMATSNEIKKRNKQQKKKNTPTKQSKENQQESSSNNGESFFGSLLRLGFYFTLIVTLSAQCEATRPTYEAYAQPYVVEYVQPVYEEYVVPKYTEFVKPHVDSHLVPAYQQYFAAHVNTAVKTWQQKVQPQLKSGVKVLTQQYNQLLAPHVDIAIEKATPVFIQVKKDSIRFCTFVQEKTADLTKNWQGTVEELIKEGRGYVAIGGNEARKFIDATAEKTSEVYARAVESLSELDLAKSATNLGNQAAETTADLTVQVGDKIGVYYQQFLDATVDHRAQAWDKAGLVWAVIEAKSGVVYQLLVDYDIAAYIEGAFESLGWSIIWIGEAASELAGWRTCCLKSRFRKLRAKVTRFSNDIYAKFTAV